MLVIIGTLLLGAAVFYLVYSIQTSTTKSAAEERLNINFDTLKTQILTPPYIRFTKPLLKGQNLRIALNFFNPKQVEKWKSLLIQAGLIKQIAPEHILGAKFWLTLIVGFASFISFFFSQNPPSPILLIGAPAFAFFWPDLHVNGLIKNRQFEIRLALPYVVDLLCLSTEAGLDFMGAIGRVVERAQPSPAIDEFAELLKDIQLGKTRAEALRDLAERVKIQEIQSLVALLVSADQMGASIGSVLRAQSEMMRNERMTRAEKLGAQASQKILIPLVLFIMPAVLLIIFGPVILSFVSGGGI